jgi:1,4-alpha-glucan branching enzyme
MEKQAVVSLILNAHLPFVRCGGDEVSPEDPPDLRHSAEEQWFFEALSETYLPLLEVCDRLDADHIPFRLGLSLSPLFCGMLTDDLLLKKYLAYTEKQIEFGREEIGRTAGDPGLQRLAALYCDRALDRRIAFTERYEGNILKALNYYRRKGRLELINTAATHAFLPFFCSRPESVQAQMEMALSSYRSLFGRYSQGFWLPELGWTAELDKYLRAYNFGYTVVESHGFVYGSPPSSRGTFYPARSPAGAYLFGRDYYSGAALSRLVRKPVYRDNKKDAGYELPAERIGPFLDRGGARVRTGYKYWCAAEERGQRRVYDPEAALWQAGEDGRDFLKGIAARLREAASRMGESPVCLCAFDADRFGRFWYEGPRFIETLFREGARSGELRFMTPSEYLYKQDGRTFDTVVPDFSSQGVNGYGETWLDASNDWVYRHLFRAQDRMIEMAGRFTDGSGLKERALNQAAREILLAQASDWPKMLYNQEYAEFARNTIEGALRNFTTIYEALGSNYISTEWLTGLERRHNFFPFINYRIFRKKK